MSFNIEDIQKLERAADIFLGDPTKVTAVERREAESYFDLLQKSNLTLEQCLYIFEHTSSPFLLFQVTKCVSLAVFRDWNTLSDSTIHSTYEFLLKFAVEHPSLPGFAVAELLKCSSRIFKRGILDDEKVNSMERMYSLIRDLITCSNEQYRVLGCQIIEALASEFATSWGGSKYGLTWDFHVRAKRKFEISGLKELFSLSLKILGDLCTFDVDAHPDYSAHDADTHLRLAEHFLRIASLILSWNFSPKIMKNSTHYHSESQHCDVAFRPPEEWKDIIQNPDLLPLFFKFHAKVRVNESLSTTSMHCISQLASIMGESMFGTATQPDYSQFHDQYLGNYVLMFQEIFEHNPSQAEIVFVTTAIFKLHSHHPLPIFFRLRQELLRGWVIHISRKTIDYTAIAVNGFLEDPNHEGFEALKYMYQTWSTIVQSKSTYYKKLAIPQGSIGFIDLLTKDILTELIRCIQHHVDVPVDEELYNDEDHEDDIVLLFDHLRHIGTFVNGCPEVTMDLLDMCVLDKVQHLPGVYNSHDWDALRLWQERTHLFLLIAGYGLTTDQSGLFIPPQIIKFCLERADSRNVMTPLDGKRFIEACMDNPQHIAANDSVEPLIRIFGYLLGLCALQHQMLTSTNACASISPTVVRSSLWAVRRLMTSLCIAEDNYSSETPGQDPDEIHSITQLIMMEKGSELSQKITTFFINFCFDVIAKMSGESKVCEEAINLLHGIGEARPREIAGNDLFYDKLTAVQLEKVTSRKLLIRTLVSIGSMCQEPQHHDRMANMILTPLAERFHSLVTSNAGGSFSDIVDLLECFCGVAEAAQSFTANILLEYLLPILELCPRVLAGAREEQAVVDGVLMLFGDVTKHLVIFIDELHVNRRVYDIVATLMEVYRDTQMNKYRTQQIDEEEQSADLIYFLDVVTNILSKDIFTSNGPGEISDGVKISLLEFNMLLPLMGKSLLSIPAVCSRFSRFLLYMTELYPETFSHVEEETVACLFEVMKAVLSSEYGTEAMVSCIETVGHIAHYFLRPDVPPVDFIQNRLSDLLPEIFITTMQNSSQVDIYKNGTTALYYIICCNKNGFLAYVSRLVDLQSSSQSRESAAKAFGDLMTGFDESGGRRFMLVFREKFEVFIAHVRGQLCLFH